MGSNPYDPGNLSSPSENFDSLVHVPEVTPTHRTWTSHYQFRSKVHPSFVGTWQQLSGSLSTEKWLAVGPDAIVRISIFRPPTGTETVTLKVPPTGIVLVTNLFDEFDIDVPKLEVMAYAKPGESRSATEVLADGDEFDDPDEPRDGLDSTEEYNDEENYDL